MIKMARESLLKWRSRGREQEENFELNIGTDQKTHSNLFKFLTFLDQMDQCSTEGPSLLPRGQGGVPPFSFSVSTSPPFEVVFSLGFFFLVIFFYPTPPPKHLPPRSL